MHIYTYLSIYILTHTVTCTDLNHQTESDDCVGKWAPCVTLVMRLQHVRHVQVQRRPEHDGAIVQVRALCAS